MNTCCHVYTNDGRGNSYEIIPFNFFWDSQTQKPSQDAGEKNSMPKSDYEFCNSYSTIDNGFNASSYSKEPTKGTLLSPWLLPTIADYISVFTDIPLSSVSADNNNISFSNDSRVKDKIKVLRHTLSVISNSSEDYNWPYWLANETGQNKFVQGSISSDGATFTIDKNVPHKSDSRKGYVLPIRYF
jgi:hypothetical protein